MERPTDQETAVALSAAEATRAAGCTCDCTIELFEVEPMMYEAHVYHEDECRFQWKMRSAAN